MFQRHYKNNASRRNILDFLIFNPSFPKALTYNLNYLQNNIQAIGFQEEETKGSLTFKIGKIATQLQFLTIEEVEENAIEFMNKTLEKLFNLARLLEEKYLIY
jgi:uncharacterized alpha-E superfamily protein